VNCAHVRDRLPEYAIGVLDRDARGAVDEHVAWCAACRKEVGDLSRSASMLAFAVEPATPDPALEERVVERVRTVASRAGRGRVQPRRRRSLVVLAAALVLSSAGIGAVVADRAAPEERAATRAASQRDSLNAFQQLLRESAFVDPEIEALLAVLEPAEGREGSGSAMSIVAPSVADRALVIVSGLPNRERVLPYRVVLTGGRGDAVVVGRVDTLDSDGGATVARIIDRDLRGYTSVVVRDARGVVVLRGILDERAAVPSPTP
jgi:hypothetical protein